MPVCALSFSLALNKVQPHIHVFLLGRSSAHVFFGRTRTRLRENANSVHNTRRRRNTTMLCRTRTWFQQSFRDEIARCYHRHYKDRCDESLSTCTVPTLPEAIEMCTCPEFHRRKTNERCQSKRLHDIRSNCVGGKVEIHQNRCHHSRMPATKYCHNISCTGTCSAWA